MKPLRLDIDRPSSLPLDLALLKADLRIDSHDLDEVLLTQYIPSAVEWAEGVMNRSIIARDHRWVLSGFPVGHDLTITLPRGKTQSVTSVAYSTGGRRKTLKGPSANPPGSDYQEDRHGHAGRLLPLRGGWPSIDTDVLAPVTIIFRAGWPDHMTVPAAIKRALTANVFEQMELIGLLTIRTGFDSEFTEKLLSGWRLF